MAAPDRLPPVGGAARAVFTFASTHLAMSAEEALLDAGLPIQVIPAPPGRGRVCGLALEIDGSLQGAAKAVLEQEGIEWAEVLA